MKKFNWMWKYCVGPCQCHLTGLHRYFSKKVEGLVSKWNDLGVFFFFFKLLKLKKKNTMNVGSILTTTMIVYMFIWCHDHRGVSSGWKNECIAHNTKQKPWQHTDYCVIRQLT